MFKVFLFLSLLTLSLQVDTSATTTPTNTINPFSDDSYIFSWNIDEAAGVINITIDSSSKGWVGFGISETGLMDKSDLVICYLSKDNVATCIDGYAQGYSFAKDESLGGSSDLNKVVGYVSNGRTILSFSKKLNSQDPYDKQIYKGLSHKVLFSYRTEGNPSTENGQFNEHSIKIVKDIILWPNGGTTITDTPSYRTDPDMRVMNLGVSRLPLPPQRTFYACRYFNVKNLTNNITQMKMGRSYHAVAYEPAIDNMKRLHHMLLFSCANSLDTKLTDQAFDCTDTPVIENCSNVVLAWAMGSGDIVVPSEAGIMWGSYETEVVLLQYHYNNEDLADGEVDSSNFRVYFTPKLRANDAGVMALGRMETMFSIPPGQKNYDVTGTCTTGCTIAAKGNINVFGYIPHGHMIMNKLVTNIVNGDKSLITLQEDPFEFTMQRFIQPTPPIVLTPGFKATTTCSYDSSARTTVTQGGYGSDNEMCYNFVMYYPKENGFSWCIDGETGLDFGCINNTKYDRDIAGENVKFSYLMMLLIAFLI
jgi:hypothetical protein